MSSSSDSPSPFSLFGDRFRASSGIVTLMDDLGSALADTSQAIHMLGGGNPAPIPEVQALWRRLMSDLLHREPDRFDRMLGFYDTQRGNDRFIKAIAAFFNRQFGWSLAPENIAITNGGQSAFFYLFNLLGGTTSRGGVNQILLPLVPEYIGYHGIALHPDTIVPNFPSIEISEYPFFKYTIDFPNLRWSESLRAVCLSRPTNPSANLLSDQEIAQLHFECRQRGLLLIIDNAYGTPFPNLVFKQATPFWGEGVVLTYSLSKLGLPGTRTGIVIGPPEICQAISTLNAAAGLATGNIGQSLTLPLFESGEISSLSEQILRPYYLETSAAALRAVQQAFEGLPVRVHAPEGALFLWLWFPDLPLTSRKLYQLLKEAGVLVVPGEYFFHGLDRDWAHARECVRIHHGMDPQRFYEAMVRFAAVVRNLYTERSSG